jgi:8-oxo-dGTP diphosphatase
MPWRRRGCNAVPEAVGGASYCVGMARRSEPARAGVAGSAPTGPTLVTLVYCLRDGQVLLLQRAKPPCPGLWVAPGGKVDPGESPVEGAIRELREETGLQARRTVLRGVITETSPRLDWQWLIFAYVVLDFDGVVAGDHREGRLRWWPVDDRRQIQMPEADQLFFDPVVLGTGEPYERTFHYDAELRLRLA